MVQRLEWTAATDGADPEGGWMEVTQAEDSANVNPRGANLGLGELLIGPRRLGPQDLGVLASSGYARVELGRRPVVGVLSTGDELRAAGEALGPSSIYDTNGPTLAAQALTAGAELRRYGIVRDEPRLLGEALEAGLAECDILLTSGGVSLGDYDYLPGLLVSLGVQEIFHKLAMKPGKPLWFGRRPAAPDRRQTLVFGLPGNPVSSFVGFEIFIRPAIAAFQGLDPSARFIRARLGEGVERKDTERVEYRPVRMTGPERGEGAVGVLPLRYTGSTMVQALAWADGLIRLEIGEARLEKGSSVDVRLLRS
jgi:molybdopterin molybdotransferase